MLTNPPWQTSCNSPLKSDTAVITGPKVRLGSTVTEGNADSTGETATDWELWSHKHREQDEQRLTGRFKLGRSEGVRINPSGITWRKCTWCSVWESLSSSASFFFSSVISFWILSSSCSAWLTAVFSWALISSLTSKRFSSIERISSVKTASLSSAAARAER